MKITPTKHKLKCKKCNVDIILTVSPTLIEAINAQIKNGKVDISGKCEVCNEDFSFKLPLETDFSIEEKKKKR